ncbi:hypothetical protein BLNAU_20651 [Blattamonas nauphoetae]|uniref:Uncharacterized protein n=1 Tax=Blattamonas nauphoetae TaxID=2049346 RepID=A0ABQ9WY58_9EUKA|nr:hypothetical protein BLNAU_20651 [Blattamonas nauphoetae]
MNRGITEAAHKSIVCAVVMTPIDRVLDGQSESKHKHTKEGKKAVMAKLVEEGRGGENMQNSRQTTHTSLSPLRVQCQILDFCVGGNVSAQL